MEKRCRDGMLGRECEIFCRYLTGRAPDPYVQEKYEEGHRHRELSSGSGPFDRFLSGTAGRSVFFAGLVDAYCGLLARRSLFRKKLMLLLAILECSYPAHDAIDSADVSRAGRLYLGFAGHAVAYVATLALSLPVLLVLYLTDTNRSHNSVSG